MFYEYVNLIKDEIINSTCELIRIPSKNAYSEDISMPFGKSCSDALEYMLELGKKLGFRTKNIDGYCGYIEFGDGKELMGIIGHLDVVPEGEGWTFPAFSATIDNNKIYGRGAIDDKGPVIASLYAMKIVMDNFKINKRVRLILGLNEENDWKCIDYYKSHEEHPSFGFSPDADFPCIYAEKALLNVHLEEYHKFNDDENIIITNIDCENNAMNVVPKFCSVNLYVRDKLEEHICNLQNIIKKYSYSIEVISQDSNSIIIKSYGKAAHSAHPDLGINAISHLLIVLDEFLKLNNSNIEIISLFRRYIHTQYNGEDIGIDYSDESGKLTLNVARLTFNNDKIGIHMNLRIPVHTKIDTIKEKINKLFNSTNISIAYNGEKDALYIPKDNKLITTLCNIFNEVTNSNFKPIAIGGATYARAFPNHVSFGANMPNEKDMCHQVDEFISIDNLLLATEIYAQAIYELCK